jgi:ATP-dependent DNA helicase RecQ
MLLSVPAAPPDAQARVAAMLADYQAGQEARAAEIKAYARIGTCRHGYISAYFGGEPIERCQSCDNCITSGARRSPPATTADPGPLAPPWEGDPAFAILQAMRDLPFAVGRSGLARALQGAGSSAVKADRFRLFGALAGTTQRRILEMTDALIERGFLEQFHKGPYPLLRLTAEGEVWLESQPIRAKATPQPQVAPEPAHEPDVYDAALYERLRKWRTETARAMGKPPYVVLTNKMLKALAGAKPSTLTEVAAIKGIGPRRLERYGQAVLDLLTSRENDRSDSN